MNDLGVTLLGGRLRMDMSTLPAKCDNPIGLAENPVSVGLECSLTLNRALLPPTRGLRTISV